MFKSYLIAAVMLHFIPAKLQPKFSDTNWTCLLQFFFRNIEWTKEDIYFTFRTTR